MARRPRVLCGGGLDTAAAAYSTSGEIRVAAHHAGATESADGTRQVFAERPVGIGAEACSMRGRPSTE